MPGQVFVLSSTVTSHKYPEAAAVMGRQAEGQSAGK
jgi:hypothetical protein